MPVNASTTDQTRAWRNTGKVLVLLTAATLSACGEAPSWQKLLSIRIKDQYPTFTVQPSADGGLVVERPGLPAVSVDVDAIARFCQRGPKDCNYATDQMLQALQGQPTPAP